MNHADKLKTKSWIGFGEENHFKKEHSSDLVPHFHKVEEETKHL